MRVKRSMLPLAGPLTIVVVILCWAALLAVCFALIYWGAFPDDFEIHTGKDPSAERGFLSVLYFSLEMLTTLGLGEITPKATWVRLIVSFHALIGFSLITASVSWIVLIYPALARMRTLARRTAILADAEAQTGVMVAQGDAESSIFTLAICVVETRVDLVHFPILYYFSPANGRAALSQALPHLVRFSQEGLGPESSDRVRLAATTLEIALDDLAELLSRDFLFMPGRDTAAVFSAYSRHHAFV